MKWTANNGEPCRFCGKPFEMTIRDVTRLRASNSNDYTGMSAAEVCASVDICPSCAGINKEGAE